MQRDKYTSANRKAWNESAQYHKTGEGWESLVQNFAKADFSTLDPTLTQALLRLGIDTKSAVQVCCNNGQETLSMCALGAKRCVGIDISEAFIDAAVQLKEVSGHDAEFVCSDIFDLPADTRSDFDLALITIGAINWMPDVREFFRIVRSLVQPGATLLIYETHPILDMFEPRSDNPHRPAYTYFPTEPFSYTDAIVYDGSEAPDVSPYYWFAHSLGDVVTAIGQAGFALKELKEFGHSNREVEFNIYENQEAQLPMCYLLEARAK